MFKSFTIISLYFLEYIIEKGQGDWYKCIIITIMYNIYIECLMDQVIFIAYAYLIFICIE